MQHESVHIVLLTIEIFVPSAQSLKSKRSVIRGLQDHLRAQFNASVAEIGYQDAWQRALIGVCMLSSDKRQLEQALARIEQVCENSSDFQIVNLSQEWI